MSPSWYNCKGERGYWTIGMMLVGYGSTLIAIINFARHGAFISSASLLLITLNCIRLQMVFVDSVKQWNLEVKNTLKTGFMQPKLRHWVEITISSKHALTVFIVAYSSLLLVEGRVASLVQVFSYLLSAWTVVCADVDGHMGGDLCPIGRALVSKSDYGSVKSLLLTFWSGCHVAGSVAMTALVMKVWHPVLAIALFVPCGWVKLAGVELPWWKKVFTFFFEPLEVLIFSGSSVFGFPMYLTSVMQYRDPLNLGNVRAWPLVVATIFRFSVSAALLVQYIAEFLQANTWEQMFDQKLFEAFVVVQVLIVVPLDIIAMVFQIVSNPSWRDGLQNEDASTTMLQIAESLILFEEDE